MSSKFIKPMGFALAAVLAMAPMALAQQSGSGMTGQRESSGTKMGTMTSAQDTIHATVSEVDRQQKTVTLRMQGGETVELKMPEQSLMNLNQGDSVQVSIRKAEGQSGPSGMQPSQPSSGTTSGSGTGTTPRSTR
jgi:hypothetical protein